MYLDFYTGTFLTAWILLVFAKETHTLQLFIRSALQCVVVETESNLRINILKTNASPIVITLFMSKYESQRGDVRIHPVRLKSHTHSTTLNLDEVIEAVSD